MSRLRARHPGLVCVPLLALACLVTPQLARPAVANAKVTGTATYRERVALMPGAVLEATLEDVSRTDAPAEVIARTHKTDPGQVPIKFKISYDPKRIVAGRKYVVRARITESGRLRFASSEAAYVLTNGHGSSVSILMHAVSWGDALDGLVNNRWRPVTIGATTLTVSGSQHEPWILLNAHSMTVTGSGGCNRISGGFAASRDTLRFGRMISTMMACPAMDTEHAFLQALDKTRRYRVQGRTLELLDGHGRTLARLEERNLE